MTAELTPEEDAMHETNPAVNSKPKQETDNTTTSGSQRERGE